MSNDDHDGSDDDDDDDEEDRNLASTSPGEGDPAATVAIIVNNFHPQPNIRPLRQPHLIKN